MAKPATETAEGEEARLCFRCDETETKVIPKIGHKHELTRTAAKAATCTEAGNIEYWVCDGGEHPCNKYFSDAEGKTEVEADSVVIKALGHDWSEWKETKAATETAEGEETRTCARCDEAETRAIPKVEPKPTPAPTPADASKDPGKMGEDGTPIGPGASAAAAEKALTNMANDNDLPGSAYSKLKLRSPKQTNTSIRLNWTKVNGATKYVLYANKCGKTTKLRKLIESRGTTLTVKNVAGAKVRKGTYYKFIIVALNSKGMVVSTSKIIHVATKGGKAGNNKSVTVKKTVTAKAKKLKVGKSLKVKAKAVPQSKTKKVSTHRKMRYESSNPAVASVGLKTGKITAKKKGTCYVYAYAQNGVYKRIKVVVK